MTTDPIETVIDHWTGLFIISGESRELLARILRSDKAIARIREFADKHDFDHIPWNEMHDMIQAFAKEIEKELEPEEVAA